MTALTDEIVKDTQLLDFLSSNWLELCVSFEETKYSNNLLRCLHPDLRERALALLLMLKEANVTINIFLNKLSELKNSGELVDTLKKRYYPNLTIELKINRNDDITLDQFKKANFAEVDWIELCDELNGKLFGIIDTIKIYMSPYIQSHMWTDFKRSMPIVDALEYCRKTNIAGLVYFYQTLQKNRQMMSMEMIDKSRYVQFFK